MEAASGRLLEDVGVGIPWWGTGVDKDLGGGGAGVDEAPKGGGVGVGEDQGRAPQGPLGEAAVMRWWQAGGPGASGIRGAVRVCIAVGWGELVWASRA